MFCRILSCVGHCKVTCSAVFFCTYAVETCSGVLTPNTMEVGRQQRRASSTNLCYGDSLMSGPVTARVGVVDEHFLVVDVIGGH